MLFYSIYNKASLLSLLFILLLLIIDSNMPSIDIYYYLLYVIYFLALVSTIHWRFIYIGNLSDASNNKSINENQNDNLFYLSKNMLIISLVFSLKLDPNLSNAKAVVSSLIFEAGINGL